jgi:hypothetical protein
VRKLACLNASREACTTSFDSSAQTLLDMPTEVLATICARCDVPTKMVRRRLIVLLVMCECMRSSVVQGSTRMSGPFNPHCGWCSALRRHASACALCWRNLLITLRYGEL